MCSDRKYTIDGMFVSVIQKLDNGEYLVSPILYDEDDEYPELFESPDVLVVDKVFDEPPSVYIDKEIEDRQNKLNQLNDQILYLEIQYRDQKKKYEEQAREFSSFLELRNLKLFIDKKITHFVRVRAWDDLEIASWEETIGVNGFIKKGLKLLTLFGNSSGDLQWEVNHYSDGSGGYSEVFPCVSYDEALVYAQNILDKRASRNEISESDIEFAKEHNLHIPKECKADVKKRKIESLEKSLAKELAVAEETRLKLEALKNSD